MSTYLDCDYTQVRGLAGLKDVLEASINAAVIRVVAQYQKQNPHHCRFELWILCFNLQKEPLSYVQEHDWYQPDVTKGYIAAKAMAIANAHIQAIMQ